jgi:hypothetical protein
VGKTHRIAEQNHPIPEERLYYRFPPGSRQWPELMNLDDPAIISGYGAQYRGWLRHLH